MKLLDSIIRESRANPVKHSSYSLDTFTIPAYSVAAVEKKVTPEQHYKESTYKAINKPKETPAEEPNIQKISRTLSSKKNQIEEPSNVNVNSKNISPIKQQIPNLEKTGLEEKKIPVFSKEADQTTQVAQRPIPENNTLQNKEQDGRAHTQQGESYIQDTPDSIPPTERNNSEPDTQDNTHPEQDKQKEKNRISAKKVKKTADKVILSEQQTFPVVGELPQIKADLAPQTESSEIRIGQINVTVYAPEPLQQSSQGLPPKPEPFGLRRI